ncbi:MAG: peptidoglycan DD-metalloendopeptidase family protein [Chloroflexota bacterium]
MYNTQTPLQGNPSSNQTPFTDSTRYVSHAVIFLLILLGLYLGGFANLALEPLQLPAHTSSTNQALTQSSIPGEVTSSNATESTPLRISTDLPQDTSGIIQVALPRIAVEAPEPVVETQVRSEEVSSYQVQPGDTIYGIALSFGLTPETILWANPNLEDNPDLLQLGQELTVLPVNGVYHQVKSGDTIANIATTYKVDPAAITDYSLNQLEGNGGILTPDEWLIVPDGIKPYVAKRVSSISVSAPASALAGTGNFQWPADGSITQEFWSRHRGLDIGAWQGAPIYAADSGYIVAAQWDDTGYGRMILIDHGNGFRTLYAHLSVFFVDVGDEVTKGQQIANMGSTGNSTGPHLHFEITLNGTKRNPWGFLP